MNKILKLSQTSFKTSAEMPQLKLPSCFQSSWQITSQAPPSWVFLFWELYCIFFVRSLWAAHEALVLTEKPESSIGVYDCQLVASPSDERRGTTTGPPRTLSMA